MQKKGKERKWEKDYAMQLCILFSDNIISKKIVILCTNIGDCSCLYTTQGHTML